ncbi:MAG: hypothetical protein PHD76_12835 [Methylacidiphilales bacterium]|nr:hypothetical protein [Candidatus Methylacidiphilales bacterium]
MSTQIQIVRHLTCLCGFSLILSLHAASAQGLDTITNTATGGQQWETPAEIREGLQKQLTNLAIYLVQPGGENKPAGSREWAGKALALASTIYPEDKQKVAVLQFQLAHNVTPQPVSSYNLKSETERMFALATTLSQSQKKFESRLANYLVELIAQADPLNEPAVTKFVSMPESNGPNDWSRIGYTPAPTPPAAGNTATATATTSNTIVSHPISSSNTPETPLLLHKSSISSLLITEAASGTLVGQVNDLIASVQKVNTDKTLEVSFNQEVGDEMKTSLQEAVRMIEAKIPDRSVGFTATLGFEDKYTPKDGGSAGTACSLLILSLLQGTVLDEKAAVTGDITADGKVRKIGGVAEKIGAAQAAKCTLVAIPDTNAPDIEDMLVMRPSDILTNIQIFSIKDIDQAKELACKDRSEPLKQSMELFQKLAESINSGHSISAPDTREQLNKVLGLTPNHLSARFLLQKSLGRIPARMSLEGSLREIFSASSYFTPAIFNKNIERDASPQMITVRKYSPEQYQGALDKLNSLNFKVDPRVSNIQDAIYDFVNVWQKIAESNSSSKDTTLKGKLLENRNKVLDELSRLQYDDKAITELIRSN